MKQILTTSDVGAQRRLDYWRSSLSDMYAPLDIKDYDAEDFHSEIVSSRVDKLTISQIDGVQQTIARPKSLIRSWNCDDYVAVVQLEGSIFNSTNGNETKTGPGTITLYDLARPYELQSTGKLSIIDISISRTDFERAFGPAASCVGLSLDADQASAPVIVAFFRSLAEYGHLADGPTAERLATMGRDLIMAGFAERLAREPHSKSMSAATYLYRAKAFIEANLASNIDVAAIAAALALSVRRVHSIFAEHGLTVDAYIWERRLTKAAHLLRDPAHDVVSIAGIGYEVGFTDPSHFARRFRSHYATTASGYREEARLQRAGAGKAEA